MRSWLDPLPPPTECAANRGATPPVVPLTGWKHSTLVRWLPPAMGRSVNRGQHSNHGLTCTLPGFASTMHRWLATAAGSLIRFGMGRGATSTAPRQTRMHHGATARWTASNSSTLLRSGAVSAFFGRHLHSRMPLDPTHVRLKRAGVWPVAFLSVSTSLTGWHCKFCPNTEGVRTLLHHPAKSQRCTCLALPCRSHSVWCGAISVAWQRQCGVRDSGEGGLQYLNLAFCH
jgi:hypothetical protein